MRARERREEGTRKSSRSKGEWEGGRNEEWVKRGRGKKLSDEFQILRRKYSSGEKSFDFSWIEPILLLTITGSLKVIRYRNPIILIPKIHSQKYLNYLSVTIRRNNPTIRHASEIEHINAKTKQTSNAPTKGHLCKHESYCSR